MREDGFLLFGIYPIAFRAILDLIRNLFEW
jgi:hypothetical protein